MKHWTLRAVILTFAAAEAVLIGAGVYLTLTRR